MPSLLEIEFETTCPAAAMHRIRCAYCRAALGQGRIVPLALVQEHLAVVHHFVRMPDISDFAFICPMGRPT